MDQSLRTVATQLLNVTNPDETPKIVDKDAVRNSATSQKQPAKNEASLIKEINSEISNLESMGVGFGRPMNSKFGYFESSHPGQAMAMTEEELEKEMSSTRLITAYKKNHPTTTGGISTWILLNPPSTTVKTSDDETNNERPTADEARVTARPTTVMERVETFETTEKVEKLTSPVPTTIIFEQVVSSTKRPVVATTKRNANKSENVQSSTSKVPRTTTASSLENRDTTVPSVTVTKKVQIVRKTSPKVKVTTQKATTTVLPKPSGTRTTTKPGQPARPKPSTRRTTTVKPEIQRHENASTAKIEKVTIRPTEVTPTPKDKTNVTEKPMFVTKIKASVVMDTQKATTIAPASSTASIIPGTSVKPNLSNLVEVPVRSKPVITKVNNVLKVQLKKPTEEATKIQIEPIKVNAPAVKIQKVEKDEKNVEEIYKDTDVPLDNSRIDLKFDFNPELTKINVVTPTEESPSSTTTTTTTAANSTTKRPRNNSKRKKNKVRRRKPSTTSTTSTTIVPITSTLSTTTENELPTEITVTDIDIQESKIAPETKIATNASKTKTKTKKPLQKPISTQIYNFLSREVMPSFGVMSLVGLGLGLASYFLYPFGAPISRRNYEVVEPKYKYNLDEYGGNYGQSEEEVMAKVLQGMRNPDEDKYPGTKDSESNYYRYQHYDGGAYDSQTTRRTEQRYTSASPMYRPESAASGSKYRDTEYRYSEPASTPNYYDRSKQQSEHGIGQRHEASGSADRQFVVGNVPKGYPPYEEKVSSAVPGLGKLTGGNDYESADAGESGQTQNFNFPASSIKVRNYGRPEVQTQRTVDEERYQEEIEISPTAVAVEHGPRSLKAGRSKRIHGVTILSPSKTSISAEDVETAVEGRSSRSKRESVIQVIPSKRELEEEEKEEDLSNEIRDIIDSALPVAGDEETTKHRREENEVEDLEGQKRKHLEEERTRLKESTMRTPIAGITKNSVDSETHLATSDVTSSTESYSSPAPSSTESSTDIDDKNDSASTSTSTEESTHEWIDLTTKRPASEENSFNLFNFVKKVAEVKFRLGLTLLKHASEGFARYLGHVQKRINGEE